MQRVKTSANLIHPLMTEMNTLYAELSVKKQERGIVRPTHDERLRGLVEIFRKYGECNHEFNYVTEPVGKLSKQAVDPKNILVCFSGGKDSYTTARHYQKLGYNVYLYHLRGLNATYCGKASESLIAQECAEYMGLPLIIEDVGYQGYHEWTEHPMKNLIMLNHAISYGVNERLTTKVAIGTFYHSYLKDNPFDVCGGDCVDFLREYEKIIKTFLPEFRLCISSKNYQTAYNLLLKDTGALPHLTSCVTPNRFRQHFRERTMKNYGIELMPNRCGCCWKDCVEYIILADHNAVEFNPRYYIHCLEVLRATVYKDWKFYLYSVPYLWDLYMFYPMKKSKMFKELENATITVKGKIKCSNDDIKG